MTNEIPPPIPPPQILVVDDDPGAILMLRSALIDRAQVTFATTSAKALSMVSEQPPDLILLDGQLPDQHGFELCAQLKSDPSQRDIPIIFVTSHNDVRFEARAFELGAADFIAKPISPVLVQHRVALHLRLQQQLRQLNALVMSDPMTGLSNRRAFDAALDREWRRMRRSGRELSLLMVDVDHFKFFNDTYGHVAGDDCLRLVATALQSAAKRAGDVVARRGGEEFALLLPDTPRDGAMDVARALRVAVEQLAIPHRSSPVAPHVTISVGASSSKPTGTRALPQGEEELLRAADQALYAAKGDGRNRVAYTSCGDRESASPPEAALPEAS